MGAVTNFGGLLAVRAALGLAEGGLFPGINFLYVWKCTQMADEMDGTPQTTGALLKHIKRLYGERFGSLICHLFVQPHGSTSLKK